MRARWLPPAQRGHIWQVFPVSVAPPSPPVQNLTQARRRLLPAPRGRVFTIPPRTVRLVPAFVRQSSRMLMMRRGRVFGLLPLEEVRRKPPPQFLAGRRPGLLPQPRGRVTNYVTPPTFVPPHFGPLVSGWHRPVQPLLRSPRGHIWQVVPAGRVATPLTFSQFSYRRSQSLLQWRAGRIVQPLPVPSVTPTPGPLLTLFVRQSGSRNLVLRLVRATFVNPVPPSSVKPQPPQPPAAPLDEGGSLSVSVGRRKWPQAVLYTYPKSLVWGNHG